MLKIEGIMGGEGPHHRARGGHRRIYYPLMDERGFLKYIIETMIYSAMRDFPEETREALDEYL